MRRLAHALSHNRTRVRTPISRSPAYLLTSASILTNTSPSTYVLPISAHMRSTAYVLDGIEKWLYNQAGRIIHERGIDESHGITHLRRTHRYALTILRNEPMLTTRSAIQDLPSDVASDIVLKAAFCHDLVDSKYMDVKSAIEDLRRVFADNLYPRQWTDDIMYIIEHESFSKRVARMRAGLPAIEPGRLQLATAIVADADQLDAYDPERCYTYNKHRYAGASEDVHRKWQRTILECRVLRYLDMFIYTETAKKLATPMHDALADYIKQNLMEYETYPYDLLDGLGPANKLVIGATKCAL